MKVSSFTVCSWLTQLGSSNLLAGIDGHCDKTSSSSLSSIMHHCLHYPDHPHHHVQHYQENSSVFKFDTKQQCLLKRSQLLGSCWKYSSTLIIQSLGFWCLPNALSCRYLCQSQGLFMRPSQAVKKLKTAFSFSISVTLNIKCVPSLDLKCYALLICNIY